MATPDKFASKSVAPVEEVKDLRSAAEIAATSHLVGYKVREDADEVAEDDISDITEALSKMAMPKTLKATHQILQETLATEPRDAREVKIKKARLDKLSAHLASLADGPVAPVITSEFHKAVTSSQSEHAVLLKVNALAQIHPEVKALLSKVEGLEQAAEIPTEVLAEKIYEAYCVGVGGKAFNGDILPRWKEFVTDEKKKTQVDAWTAAAVAAKQLLS